MYFLWTVTVSMAGFMKNMSDYQEKPSRKNDGLLNCFSLFAKKKNDILKLIRQRMGALIGETYEKKHGEIWNPNNGVGSRSIGVDGLF